MRMLSRNPTLLLTTSLLVLLVGSGLAYASDQQNQGNTFHSTYEFSVTDPAEPVISTSVNGTFINHSIGIAVNMSSQQGVKQLDGIYTINVLIWNDTAGAYVQFQSLASNQKISLTPTPTTLTFNFTTAIPATYNVDVAFTTTNVVLG